MDLLTLYWNGLNMGNKLKKYDVTLSVPQLNLEMVLNAYYKLHYEIYDIISHDDTKSFTVIAIKKENE